MNKTSPAPSTALMSILSLSLAHSQGLYTQNHQCNDSSSNRSWGFTTAKNAYLIHTEGSPKAKHLNSNHALTNNLAAFEAEMASISTSKSLRE